METPPSRVGKFSQLRGRGHAVLGQRMEIDLDVASDHRREVAVKIRIGGVTVGLDVFADGRADTLREILNLLSRQEQRGADLGWTHNGRPVSWYENRRLTSQEFIASQPKLQ